MYVKTKREEKESNSTPDLELLSWGFTPHFLASPPAEMLESSNLVTFDGLANSSGYDTFLLDEERGRLLVGAEDHLFSFDLVNINRDQKQVARREETSRPWLLFEPPSPVHYSERLPRPVIPLRHLDEVSRPFYQIQSTSQRRTWPREAEQADESAEECAVAAGGKNILFPLAVSRIWVRNSDGAIKQPLLCTVSGFTLLKAS